MDISARLPWWGALLLGLTLLVLTEVLPAILADSYRQLLTPMFQVLGYVLFGACCVGALIGLYSARRSRRLYDRQDSLASIRMLSWARFEDLITETFRRQGYRVQKTKSGADGGVDVVIRKAQQTILVQCKHWRARRVGVGPVRELAGVVGAEPGTAGILVTSGGFTPEAERFAQKSGIRLIDGDALVDLLRLDQVHESQVDDTELCPRCGGKLVRRVARRGARAGEAFMGCTAFPKCRFARSITLSGRLGEVARHYQERDVRNAIERSRDER